MKTKIVLAILIVLSLSYSCTKEEDIPADLILGKWMLSSTEVLGTTSPGDGSYLIFEASTGTDYMASDSTSGTFTYELNTDGTILIINDTTYDGGYFNFTFDVLQLSEETLRITTDTGILGNMLLTFGKN